MLVHEHKDRCRNGPGILARRIGDHFVEIRVLGPIGLRGGGLEALLIGLYEFVVLVLHRGEGHFVLRCIGQFNVADRPFDLVDVRRHTFVAFSADPGRPIHGCAFTDLGFPCVADFRKIVDPIKCGTGAVRAVHHGQLRVGELQARIDRSDRRVVPFQDFAEKNVGQEGPCKFQLTRLDSLQVHYGYDTADDQRELCKACRLQFLRSQRLVRGAEGNRRRLDLCDPAARTDGLIIHLIAGLYAVGRRPLGQYGIHEG